jgi:hypothetical protein
VNLPAQHLGDLCETVSFSRWDVVAGGFIIVILGIPGALLLILPFWKAYRAHGAMAAPTFWENPVGWVLVGLTCLTGVFLIVTGMMFAKLKRDELTHRFDFCANGFRYYFRGGLDRVLWSQVVCIQETTSAFPKLARNCYKIVTASGKEYDINGSSRAIRKFGTMLRTRAAELSLPWETVEEHS